MPREGEWRDRGKDYHDREERHDYNDDDPKAPRGRWINYDPFKNPTPTANLGRCDTCGHTFRKGEVKYTRIDGTNRCEKCYGRDPSGGEDYPTPFPRDPPRDGGASAARIPKGGGKQRLLSRRTA